MTDQFTPPRVSIAVLSWNSKQITKDCIESILREVTIPYELILIENASHDGSAEMIKQDYPNERFPQIRTVFNDTNLGFAGGNNQAYEMATGEYFLLLNSDTIVHDNAIDAMVTYLDTHTDYGGATTTLLNPDGSVQYYMHRRFPTAWRLLPSLLHKRFRGFAPYMVKQYLYLDKDFSEDFDIEQAAGACLMVRKKIIDEMGELLDVKRFPLYYNDVDLSYRLAQAGWKIRCLTNVTITHLKGTSVRTLSFFKNGKEYSYASLWFFKKHKQLVNYWILKILYLVLFLALNLATPLLLLTKKIDVAQAAYRWSIIKVIITLQR